MFICLSYEMIIVSNFKIFGLNKKHVFMITVKENILCGKQQYFSMLLICLTGFTHMKKIVFQRSTLETVLYSKKWKSVSSVLVLSWFNIELLRCDLFEVRRLYLPHFMHSKHLTPLTFCMS
jgi:hypothetical protein